MRKSKKYILKKKIEHLNEEKLPIYKKNKEVRINNSKLSKRNQRSVSRTGSPGTNVKATVKKIGISIIISAYESDNYIEECLDSIENQLYFIDNNNYEVLLGIDGCIKTFNKVKNISSKYRNLRIFMMDSNKGTYITSNTLLEQVTYNNIIRFDSDDVMKPIMVSTIVENINRGDIIRFKFDHFQINNNQKVITKIDYHAKGAIFYKKFIIDRLGGYMDWVCSADSELLKRAESFSNEYLIDIPLFDRRLHENNLIFKYGGKSNIRKKYDSLVGTHTEIKIDKVVNTYQEVKNIPKRMFFYWGGGILSWMRYLTIYTFNKLNPEWEIVLIYNGNNRGVDLRILDDLEIKIITPNLKLSDSDNMKFNKLSFVHKSDLIRYFILFTEGGFYCDTDVLFFKSINDWYNSLGSSVDTVVHEKKSNKGHYITIGFLGSSKGNKFFNDVFNYGITTITNDTNKNRQSMGVILIYNMLGGRKNNFFDIIRNNYNNKNILNISDNLIYQYDFDHINTCFNDGKNIIDFSEESIGYHWYGGHPISLDYEKLLNESTYQNYNTTISKIYREINK